ncbi:hypothetical protein EXIGLDRAFT_779867 [Exidia glandulosa HHB12029]|uniref:LamB/YcsF n=1 Tax=Exidia glandulosa HHB12029 TaxID=1314781 RepID=A0A165ZBU1_EXIGL|nr:hypothetical protein EXIGLDRAFT_779867 [Exidia glandulosa HHB12029]
MAPPKYPVKINVDLGEGYGNFTCGPDEELIRLGLIDHANVACGLHVGDPLIMQQTDKLCKPYNIVVGAHPGLRLRAGRDRDVVRGDDGDDALSSRRAQRVPGRRGTVFAPRHTARRSVWYDVSGRGRVSRSLLWCTATSASWPPPFGVESRTHIVPEFSASSCPYRGADLHYLRARRPVRSTTLYSDLTPDLCNRPERGLESFALLTHALQVMSPAL